MKSRNIGVPFMATDLGGCNDIYPAIGVSGTGVIDPATGLWYLTSKTYSDQVSLLWALVTVHMLIETIVSIRQLWSQQRSRSCKRPLLLPRH